MRDPLEGQTLADRFEIESLIGVGTAGAVYRARDNTLGRVVALKVLRAEVAQNPLFASRFEHNVEAVSRLSGPDIVRILDFGNDGSIHYIVSEYVEAMNLFDTMEPDWPIPDERIVDVLVQTLGAVARAHEIGIVHTNLKHENILLRVGVDDQGRTREHVLVCDFTVAGPVDLQDAAGSGRATQPASATLFGTPEFMSPEQWRGEPLDLRSDIYSLGVVLYHLVAGRLPFLGETADELLVEHTTTAPVAPKDVYAGASEALQVVCLRALAKQPSDRYATAAEMRTALQRALLPRRASVRAPPRPVSSPPPAAPPAQASYAPAPAPAPYAPAPAPAPYAPAPAPAPYAPAPAPAPYAPAPYAPAPAPAPAPYAPAPAPYAPAPAPPSYAPAPAPTSYAPAPYTSSPPAQLPAPPGPPGAPAGTYVLRVPSVPPAPALPTQVGPPVLTAPARDDLDWVRPPSRRRAWIWPLATAVLGITLIVLWFTRGWRATPITPIPVPVTLPTAPLAEATVAPPSPPHPMQAPPAPATAEPEVSVAKASSSSSSSSKRGRAARAYTPHSTAGAPAAGLDPDRDMVPPPPPPVETVAPAPPPPAPAPPPAPDFDPAAGRVYWRVSESGGGATAGSVAHAISRIAGGWNACYQTGLRARHGRVDGAGTLHLTCDEQGRITGATFSGIEMPDVASCIRASALGVIIPNADTGQAWATISLTFSVRE
jgi:eukaryotic-like serine/threonine-protein kinase